MPPEERDRAHLWDMLDAARKAMAFVAGRTFEQYAGDELLQSAVERKIEIIGEAARRLSDQFRDAHPEVPWRPIVAQRHVLAHDYGAILHDRIWRVATVHLPELIAQLQPLLPPSMPSQQPPREDQRADPKE